MTLSRSLPYALVLVSTCASAQVDLGTVRAFLPLGVGDAWEYAYHRTECDHIAYGGVCRTQNETYTYRVVGEEVRGEDTLAVIEGPGTRALFGVRADGSGWVSETVEAGDGSAPTLPPFPYFSLFQSMANRGPIAWTFEAGGEEYTGEALTIYPPPYVLVRDVGLTKHSNSWQGTGGARWSYSWRLSGASVGEVSYGGFATAVQRPMATPMLDWSVGPNPTTGPLTVRAELPSPATVHVEVVDVLGRTVWGVYPRPAVHGLSMQVDLGGLPPGAYVVRLFVDGRPAASAAVTRVPAR